MKHMLQLKIINAYFAFQIEVYTNTKICKQISTTVNWQFNNNRYVNCAT